MVFYFSGTGNSQYAAERIAAHTCDDMCSISAAIKDGEFAYSAKTLGFVLPVYYMGIPAIVERFINELHVDDVEYTYIVLTCGMLTGNAGGMMKKLLLERGIKVDAVYSTVMVDGYTMLLPPPGEKLTEKILKHADKELDRICKKIDSRAKRSHDNHRWPFPRLVTKLSYPNYHKNRITAPFYVTDKCMGCGLCWGLCPEEAIKLTDDKPRWVKDKCSMCLSCMNHCPSQAIQYGSKTESRGRYTNPNTTIHF